MISRSDQKFDMKTVPTGTHVAQSNKWIFKIRTEAMLNGNCMYKVLTVVILFLSVVGGLSPFPISLADASDFSNAIEIVDAPRIHTPDATALKKCIDLLELTSLSSQDKKGRPTTEISDRDLLAAAVSLAGGMRLGHFSEPMIVALRNSADVIDDGELENPQVLQRLQRKLKRRMGNEYEKTIGSSIAGAKSALLTPTKKQNFDSTDMHRGWGWKLLGDDDPAFRDPMYLAQLLRESGAGGKVLNLNRSQAWPDPWKAFVDAWQKIAPADVDPHTIQFALTGTDANNMLYYIASRALHKRLGPSAGGLREAEILSFDGVYGGGSGRIGRIGLFNKDPGTDALRISSPDTPVWNPTDPVEIVRLQAIEDKALEEIKTKVTGNNPPIGGLLIEPILGARGVRFYRPEFLRKVRDLCDQLQIPIFADEVLTGGGRTGKFFSYQHYQGFEPDFITFGKGLHVSGVAQTTRGQQHWGNMPYRSVTLRQYNEALLTSALIMNRIREGNLMENAQRVGAYIVDKLQSQSFKNETRSEVERAEAVRGMGMLIYSKDDVPGVRDARGRLMPILTLTKQQADQIFGPTLPTLDPAQEREGYKRFVGEPVKLTDGSIVEGSVDHGGIQPHYMVNLQSPAMKKFLARAKDIGRTNVPFWEKIAQVASFTRQSLIGGWEYKAPVYIKLVDNYKKSERNIPLNAYLENSCGVCREQAMLLHLALTAAGFDSHYLYVRSYEDGVYVEDHGIALVKFNGEDWVVDSRSQENTGRRWADVSRFNGIRPSDTVAPMSLPAYRYDPSGTRFEVAPYPQIWVPNELSSLAPQKKK